MNNRYVSAMPNEKESFISRPHLKPIARKKFSILHMTLGVLVLGYKELSKVCTLD
jgi:hypothetical protein